MGRYTLGPNLLQRLAHCLTRAAIFCTAPTYLALTCLANARNQRINIFYMIGRKD